MGWSTEGWFCCNLPSGARSVAALLYLEGAMINHSYSWLGTVADRILAIQRERLYCA